MNGSVLHFRELEQSLKRPLPIFTALMGRQRPFQKKYRGSSLGDASRAFTAVGGRAIRPVCRSSVCRGTACRRTDAHFRGPPRQRYVSPNTARAGSSRGCPCGCLLEPALRVEGVSCLQGFQITGLKRESRKSTFLLMPDRAPPSPRTRVSFFWTLQRLICRSRFSASGLEG